jgi:hypothetical protein
VGIVWILLLIPNGLRRVTDGVRRGNRFLKLMSFGWRMPIKDDLLSILCINTLYIIHSVIVFTKNIPSALPIHPEEARKS